MLEILNIKVMKENEKITSKRALVPERSLADGSGKTPGIVFTLKILGTYANTLF